MGITHGMDQKCARNASKTLFSAPHLPARKQIRLPRSFILSATIRKFCGLSATSVLNRLGYCTGKGKRWNQNRVGTARHAGDLYADEGDRKRADGHRARAKELILRIA